MDGKLKEAIETVRTGDKRAAQQQLTALLDQEPQQVQGWYLLSLLVDSPQKQAAYLSKTLALNPNHEKAKAQLAALEATGSLAPTATIEGEVLDVMAQADSDALPDWLANETGDVESRVVAEQNLQDTAVPNENLPDWLKEPAELEQEDEPESTAATVEVEETATEVNQVEDPTPELETAVVKSEQIPEKTVAKPAQKTRAVKQDARNLNLILGVLVTLAIIVMVLLAYLLLS